MKLPVAEGRRRPRPSSGELCEPTQSRLPLRSWWEVPKGPTRRMVIFAARVFALALQNKRVRSSCGSTFSQDSGSGSRDARSAFPGRTPMPTESQSRDTALRLRVRQRIENGQLPVVVSKQIAGGYGSGRVCVACDEPITSAQVEYEIKDERGDSQLRFHLGCHVLWQLECAEARAEGDERRQPDLGVS
jgi:hypothetical protein